ncbi:MAG: phosphate acyltransferase [Gemmatimonadales bacterium]
MAVPFGRDLLARAAGARRRVVLSEGDDARVREAARTLAAGTADVTLLGGEATRQWAKGAAPSIRVRDPASDPSLGKVAEHLRARRPDKTGSPEDPLRFAAALVALGEADATVGGAVHTTADVLRAALWAVGPASGITTVSSSMYMVTENFGVLTFADCGVVQYPTAAQLADIALAAARDRRRIVGDEPRVAFLSHGTRGSAEGESVDRVRAALARLRETAPDITADGELQADAALVPEIAARKARGSALAGNANVLVFPDLDSGNIAYKLVQRIARAVALGPVVQGLAKPCNDLSRGASADDIVLVAAIAILQADTL